MTQAELKPEGPLRATPGQFLYDLQKLDSFGVGSAYTDAKGTAVQGDRMIVALVRLPASAVTEVHHHPNEQWIYIIEGTYVAEVDGKRFECGPGSVVYQPSNVPHGGVAGPDGDLVFFTVKDTSYGIQGIKGR